MSGHGPEGRLPAEGSRPGAVPACYTTGRYRAERVRHGARLVARLARDAAALGLGVVDEAACRRELLELGRTAFGAGCEGIVRLEAGLDEAGALQVRGETRPLGEDGRDWEAVVGRAVHPGPGPAPGAKRSSVPWLEAARWQARDAGVAEALLFDGAGLLVEGARTNLVVLCRDGSLRTPPLARGAVAGVARAILIERIAELEERDVSRRDLDQARALVAVNAVRGARRILWLDQRPLGRDGDADLAEHLGRVLDQEG